MRIFTNTKHSRLIRLESVITDAVELSTQIAARAIATRIRRYETFVNVYMKPEQTEDNGLPLKFTTLKIDFSKKLSIKATKFQQFYLLRLLKFVQIQMFDDPITLRSIFMKHRTFSTFLKSATLKTCAVSPVICQVEPLVADADKAANRVATSPIRTQAWK